jgi:predicted TPR repeat methyltransferase
MEVSAWPVKSEMPSEGFYEVRRSDARPLVKHSLLISPSADGYLAYDLDTDTLLHLNPTASLVLELCDGTRDLAALSDVLLPVVGEPGWAAYGQWINEALASGLLVVNPESADPRPAISARALRDIAAKLRADHRSLPAFICQQRATALEPDDPEMWYYLGEIAHCARRLDDARAAYQRYFTACPGDSEIGHLLQALSGVAPPRASDQYIEHVFERFAETYDELMVQSLEYRAPALLFEALSAAVGEQRQLTLLDLGCGTGLLGCVLRPLAHRLEGVDLSAPMMERARERGVYDALHKREITRFLASDEHGLFDVIAASDTLIYFGDLRQVVTLAANRLAPGGVLAFTVERTETPSFQITDSGRYVHHRDYLVDVIREAGLDMVGLTEGVLRLEFGDPVWGLVATARRRWI